MQIKISHGGIINTRFSANVSSHIYGEYCCNAEIEDLLINVKEYPDELLGDTAKVGRYCPPPEQSPSEGTATDPEDL